MPEPRITPSADPAATAAVPAAARAAVPTIAPEMAAYYAKRAASYERIYHRPERQAELQGIARWLADQFDGRSVLEVACGTGWWTPAAAARARRWLATDVNPETLAIARHKAMPACVALREVDAWTWQGLAPDDSFDAAFAGCWWSHVPLPQLPGWLASLHQRLRPGARVLMLDNRHVPGQSTPISHSDADGNTWQQRMLDDGSHHTVLKNYPSADSAAAALGPRARHVQWLAHTHFWVLRYTLA